MTRGGRTFLEAIKDREKNEETNETRLRVETVLGGSLPFFSIKVVPLHQVCTDSE